MASKHEQSPPTPVDAYKNPVDRFAHLPEHTREFLERLDKEDIATFIDILRAYQRAATIGWFFKWLVVTMVGTFMAAVAFGESVKRAYSWFMGD